MERIIQALSARCYAFRPVKRRQPGLWAAGGKSPFGVILTGKAPRTLLTPSAPRGSWVKKAFPFPLVWEECLRHIRSKQAAQSRERQFAGTRSPRPESAQLFPNQRGFWSKSQRGAIIAADTNHPRESVKP